MNSSREEQVAAALDTTTDPILNRPLHTLGYVKSVRVKRLGSAVIDLAIPVPGAPGHQLIEAVTAAAGAVAGVRSVRVEHHLMTADARRRERPAGSGHRTASPGPLRNGME